MENLTAISVNKATTVYNILETVKKFEKCAYYTSIEEGAEFLMNIQKADEKISGNLLCTMYDNSY